MGSLPVFEMDTGLIEGYPYRIMNAARRHTVLGPRLFVELAAPWGNVVCKLPFGMLNLFTDHQIELINRYRLALQFAYFGETRSGNPLVRVRHVRQSMPTWEEMEAFGALLPQ
jgi:hypothetical protein